ncbi:MAG: phytanoyl-CoA dioxygenase family protein [Planctomycetes bacterium]|nr:phytanoyl-CoA dioxygenase family protein [Planctomycetota bacterium]
MEPESRRRGDRYVVTPEERERFHRDGYVHLHGVLAEDELRELERDYDRFLRREIAVPGKDFCDMSGDYQRTPDEYSIVNVMLPRRYHAAWQGNLYERRAASIAEALQGPGLVLDYDQLLAKRPFKEDAVFGWHQDLAYWIVTPDTRTATCWLAVDDSTLENGCLRFAVGSHREPTLRPHRPASGDREKSHALVCDVDETRDCVRAAPIRRGDVTVHSERVAHGSGGNRTAGWRRAYVVAFRSAATVAEERRRGFTHSHNDEIAVLKSVGVAGESR